MRCFCSVRLRSGKYAFAVSFNKFVTKTLRRLTLALTVEDKLLHLTNKASLPIFDPTLEAAIAEMFLRLVRET
jgi:hypothetical protein